MRYRFVTCDVFTQTRFGGNPLAVLPEAQGLTDDQMQRIAREFNYSETTFVLPPEAGHTRRVRIFTPAQEVPFAGHPNVGTAFVLATTGALGDVGAGRSVTFEEKAGLVQVEIRAKAGRVESCELQAPQAVAFGETVPCSLVASAVSLPVADVLTRVHEPRVASVGLPFLFAEVRPQALERMRIDTKGFEAIGEVLGAAASAMLYLYARDVDGAHVRARMFAPLSGVPEDPATGSAGCAVAGLLAHHEPSASGAFSYRIVQGVEMGRPSLLLARARKSSGVVDATWIGGSSVLVAEGEIEVG